MCRWIAYFGNPIPMRMLLYGFEVVDLYLEPRPNGAWEVVEARVRNGVFS